MVFRALNDPAYRSVFARTGWRLNTALRRAGRQAIEGVAYVARKAPALVSGVLVQSMVPASVICFTNALDQRGFGHLARRFSDAFGAGPSFKLFNGALWPLDYLYRLPWTGPALTWFGAGCGLLVAVNLAHLHRQTVENRALKLSMTLWGVSLALLAADVARCLLLPAAWDAFPILEGLPAGDALRFAQMLTALYLWSFTLVTARSRVDVNLVRGWSLISIEVMSKLRLQAIILFLLGDLLLNFLAGARDLLKEGHDTSLIYAAMGLAVFLFFSPAFIALSEAVSYAVAMLSDGRLIIPTMSSPKRPERW
jgi:hypothetical protein